MPMASPATRHLRARLARATNDRRVSPEALAELRRDHAASAIADNLAAKLSGVPMLTTEQYDALHAVIRHHRLQARS
jgi:hypothetical protein